MKFGVCESLPVPVLWGGKQMRKYGLLDYHAVKTVAMTVEEKRIILPSTSWMAAAMEMREEAQAKGNAARRMYLSFPLKADWPTW
jgi:hypothetical protein